MSSDLGGSFVRLGSRHIHTILAKNGSAHFFGLYHPQIGTHNITAHVDLPGHDFSAVAGNSLFYRGSAGAGAVASSGSTFFGSTPLVSIGSAVDNMVAALQEMTQTGPGHFANWFGPDWQAAMRLVNLFLAQR